MNLAITVGYLYYTLVEERESFFYLFHVFFAIVAIAHLPLLIKLVVKKDYLVFDVAGIALLVLMSFPWIVFSREYVPLMSLTFLSNAASLSGLIYRLRKARHIK